jgi:hypothetical protein
MSFSSKITPISLSSSDRDRTLYPNPNSYRLKLPYPISNVEKIQIASLELPALTAQYTIEANLNDRFTFSEGLKIDLGEVLHTNVDSLGVSMYNNMIAIKENSNIYRVSTDRTLPKQRIL